jgi:hypothetical protein
MTLRTLHRRLAVNMWFVAAECGRRRMLSSGYVEGFSHVSACGLEFSVVWW